VLVTLPLVSLCGLVAYDGTEFHGFQLQPAVPTIQGELEAALQRLTQTPVRVHGAGRTDRGVHASGQVIAAEVEWRHSVEALQRAWNAHLPRSIAVRRLQPAPVGFHPRFRAVARTYRYTVIESAEQSRSAPRHAPLADRFAYYVTRRLDLAAMQTAAERLVGEHDFATFGQPPVGEQTVRVVEVAEWQVVATTLPPLSAYPGRCLVFTIRANAFLYQMVRNLVGALLEVGCGRWQVADLVAALQARRRDRAAPPAPPHGLVLERVDFPPGLGLNFDDRT
jgi:tRNA pseudouridine38-40 synthase